jgi:hypothetical protein
VPSISERQRKFIGIVLAAKRGQVPNPSKKVSEAANGMTTGQVKDFATKKKRDGILSSIAARRG